MKSMTKDQMRMKLEYFHKERLDRIGFPERLKTICESYNTMSYKKIEKEYYETFFNEQQSIGEICEIQNTINEMF